MSNFTIGVDPLPHELAKKIFNTDPGYPIIVRTLCKHITRDRTFAMAARRLYEEACKILKPTDEEKIEAAKRLFAAIERDTQDAKDEAAFYDAIHNAELTGENQTFITSRGINVTCSKA